MGVFPCRGWVAPCRALPAVSRECRFDVNAAKAGVSQRASRVGIEPTTRRLRERVLAVRLCWSTDRVRLQLRRRHDTNGAFGFRGALCCGADRQGT